jgi:tetratricopeptide (TPR) repeat protein
MRPTSHRRLAAAAAALLLAGCVSTSESPAALTADQRRQVDACLREGDQARRAGDLDAADAAYESALGIYPQLAEAHYQRGNIQLERLRLDAELRHAEAAINNYTAALRAVPTFTKAFYNRAVAFYQLAERRWGDLYKLAAKDLQRLLEASPRDADAHYFLAVIYDQHLLGMEAEALRHYLKYVELGGKKLEAQKRALALAPFFKAEKPGEAKPVSLPLRGGTTEK